MCSLLAAGWAMESKWHLTLIILAWRGPHAGHSFPFFPHRKRKVYFSNSQRTVLERIWSRVMISAWVGRVGASLSPCCREAWHVNNCKEHACRSRYHSSDFSILPPDFSRVLLEPSPSVLYEYTWTLKCEVVSRPFASLGEVELFLVFFHSWVKKVA